MQSKEASSKIFFRELIKTQLFYDCVMNLSFATELDPSLAESFAFFAQCCSKVMTAKEEEKFLELNESNNDQTIFVLPPNCDLKEEDYSMEGDNLEIKDLISIKGSEFLYNCRTDFISFPRIKQELGIENESLKNSTQNLLLNNLNEAPHGEREPSNNSNSLDPNKADTQSISSNSQPQNRKIKMPNTPIGVRTKAEKYEEQKVCKNIHSM